MNRVLIFAGGTGQRMTNASVPKQFLKVHNKPIIVHTIEFFQNCSKIDSIVVVCLERCLEHMRNLAKEFKLTKVVSVVPGGETGQQSIFYGLRELVRLYGQNNDDIVLIHDGVRPLINEKLIIDNIENAKKYGNSITVTKSTETIVLLDDGNNVLSVEDRARCNKARAPQTYKLREIYNNHLKAIEENRLDFIDSAMLMNYYGTKLHTNPGPEENIKITTPLDYYLFKAMLDYKENEQVRLL